MSTPIPAHLEAARRRAEARRDEQTLTVRDDGGASPTGADMNLAADPLTEDDEVTMVDTHGLGAKALRRLASAAHGRGIGADEISAALHELCVLDEPSMEAPAWGAGAAEGKDGNAAGPQGSAPPSGQGGGAGGNGRGAPKWKPPQEGPVGETRAAVYAMLLQLIPADSAVWSELRDPLCMKVPCEARPVLRDVLDNPTPNAANVVSYLLSSTIYQDEMTAEGVYYRYLRVVSMFVGLACESNEPAQYDWRDVALELTSVRRDLTIVREIAQAKVDKDGDGLAVRVATRGSVRTRLYCLLHLRDHRIMRVVPLHARLSKVLDSALTAPTIEMAEVLFTLADYLGPQPLPSAYTEDGYAPGPQHDGPEYDAARLVWCFAKFVEEAAQPHAPAYRASVWASHDHKIEQLERDLNTPMQHRLERRQKWQGSKPWMSKTVRERLAVVTAALAGAYLFGALSAYLAAALGWLG